MSGTDELHVLRGGAGDPLLVLLHGMGANAEVWQPMLATASAHWPGRWIAPDLRGHGRSIKDGPFAASTFATDIAALISHEEASEIVVVGHSFGGFIASLLGSNAYGVQASRVVAVGVKLEWTDEDVARMQALASRPAPDFETSDEAAGRALAFAGLKGLAAIDSAVAQAGVVPRGPRFGLAFNTGVIGGADKDVARAVRECRVPLRLASGEHDAMAPIESLRQFDPEAVVISGVGHNAHWEAPDAVWRLLRT